MTVKEELRSIREELLLTQAEAAKIIGISQQLYAYYETSARQVPHRIVNLLRVRLQEQRKDDDLKDFVRSLGSIPKEAIQGQREVIDSFITRIDKALATLQ